MNGTTIVIPVHGRAALTKRCLEAVFATVPQGTEVLVVDDASPDDTADMLASFSDAIGVVGLQENSGFAAACNKGAAEAGGDRILFLNNDTEPRSGWLQAMDAYAEEHPEAAVVGAKLVYPTGAIQHAGVVFGQDGFPHNLYAGLPADHPAANHSRRLQAVTAACALVRRDAFDRADGFDIGYENSLEDVDLCLRIGESGGEVHYCHRAEVVHLESASRGRDDRFEVSVALYRKRWRDRVRRDDLSIYVEDGLIGIEYPDAYPLRMSISPLLSVVDRGREDEIELLLERYASLVSDLLQEVVRLTAGTGPREMAGQASHGGTPAGHADLLSKAAEIEEDIRQLQSMAAGRTMGLEPSSRLGYRALVARIHAEVSARTPAGATVLVISRGDRELLSFDGRNGKHFPQDTTGQYAGHHPADSDEAISGLESLREKGATYLVVPASASWWNDQYDAFFRHLDQYEKTTVAACTIYRLENGG